MIEKVKHTSNLGEENQRVHIVEIENEIPTNWEIDYGKEIEIPKELIKYYSADQYGYNVLKNGKIWASHPFDFNDPFDCSIQMWDLKTFPLVEAKKLVEEFVFFGKSSNLNLFETRKILLELVLRFIGIYCLNDKKNSDLFWGYYSNHKGFSIEFKTDNLNSSFGMKPFQLEYKELLESDKLSLIPAELSNGKIFPKLLRWATLKKLEWTHENEWRYIFMNINLGNTNRTKKIDLNDIHEIVLGYKFFADTSNEWINKCTIKYLFKDNYKSDYSYKILQFLFENKHLLLKQVYLNEDFSFSKEVICIEKIFENEVTIVRE